MSEEQNHLESDTCFGRDEDVSLKHKWKSISTQSTISGSDSTGCFDCNICLESANDPVVTLCGHLFCWPCIYKWLHVQISSDEPDQQQKCPVCKANVSDSSLVPLYGRGTSNSDSEANKPQLGPIIPRRPLPSTSNTSITSTTTSSLQSNQELQRNYFQHHQQYFSHPYNGYTPNAPSHLGGVAMTSLLYPTIGMFGEMGFARMFGSHASLFSYPYPNSYPVTGNNGSPRMRRQDMELDKSLSRVSIFLFCCFILCLLLF